MPYTKKSRSEPFQQSVRNPFSRVSGTLSEPVSNTHRRLIRDISKMPLTRENTKNGNEMTLE